MKPENKDLLLRDLCARLPYGVKCQIGNHNYVIYDISLGKQYDMFYNSEIDFLIGVIGTEYDGNTFYTSAYGKHVKPYLFPLSSMTKEQRNELKNLLRQPVLKSLDEEDIEFPTLISANPSVVEIDYYNKNHIDYRGLIPMGLAIDCTNLNIY